MGVLGDRHIPANVGGRVITQDVRVASPRLGSVVPFVVDASVVAAEGLELELLVRKAVFSTCAEVIPSFLTCSVSCDHIPRRSWALFRARDVMRGVIESFKAEQAA